MLGFLLNSGRMGSLEKRLARVQRKFEMLLAQLNLQIEDNLLDRVREVLRTGGKIAAIRLYREETGAGLAEAKEAVEKLG